jgi:hypothetical protein
VREQLTLLSTPTYDATHRQSRALHPAVVLDPTIRMPALPDDCHAMPQGSPRNQVFPYV